jgi:hypothetical protein
MTTETAPPKMKSKIMASSQAVADSDVAEKEQERSRSEQQHHRIGHGNLASVSLLDDPGVYVGTQYINTPCEIRLTDVKSS